MSGGAGSARQVHVSVCGSTGLVPVRLRSRRSRRRRRRDTDIVGEDGTIRRKLEEGIEGGDVDENEDEDDMVVGLKGSWLVSILASRFGGRGCRSGSSGEA